VGPPQTGEKPKKKGATKFPPETPEKSFRENRRFPINPFRRSYIPALAKIPQLPIGFQDVISQGITYHSPKTQQKSFGK